MQKELKFVYQEADGAYRPIIPIDLIRGNKMMSYNALVDSGADFCLFDCEMAEVLGIKNLNTGEPVGIVGLNKEGIRGYEHEIRLCVNDIEYVTTVVFAECELPGEYGVLGQKGFFSRFIVTMDYSAKLIVLQPKIAIV